jgi:hypothetical protein
MKLNNTSVEHEMAHGTPKLVSLWDFKQLVLVLFSLFAMPALALAQAQPLSDEEAAEAAAACGAMAIVMVAIPIAILILNIVLLVWVARDAKSRGMDSAVVWMLLVFFLSLLGLVIYVFSRPKGIVVPCGSCNNKRLEASAQCPHCGNA